MAELLKIPMGVDAHSNFSFLIVHSNCPNGGIVENPDGSRRA
jgi:hypothetical protein